MQPTDLDNSTFRFERKFFITSLCRAEVDYLLSVHPANFREIFHERMVNNIYFDTIGLRNYWDNVEGSQHRTKTRIRWYGELFGDVPAPILEMKIKNGLVGEKKQFSLPPFSLDKEFSDHSVKQLIIQSSANDQAKEICRVLEPTLINRYKRKYYQSFDRNYRITVDTKMEYIYVQKNSNTYSRRFRDDSSVIMELKYQLGFDSYADSITKYFPFRLTKSSKYVTGIDTVLN